MSAFWRLCRALYRLTSLCQSEFAVTCTLRKAAGNKRLLEGSWLIACDGAHSTAHHSLALPFEGDTLPSQWMLADVQLRGMPNAQEMHIFLHEAGALAIFPIGQPGGFGWATSWLRAVLRYRKRRNTKSPLNGTGVAGQPKPGTHAPSGSDEVPLSSGSSPRFTFFAAISTGWPALIQRFPQLLEPDLRQPFHGDGIWLVRPDGYVSVATAK